MSFGGLYISVSGINANKKALDTISHNISNANNKIYVRQSAIHAEAYYNKNVVGGYQLGTGVTVQQIRQIRDEFLDLRLRNEMAAYGYFNSKSEILGEIEAIFNEITSSGLQSVMDDFWDGWAELYKEPESLTIRGLLHESAVALVTTVNHISRQMDNLQINLNKEMLNKSQEINDILRDIADLNKDIKLHESFQRVTANDYRDSRNAKLDRLSELLPIKYYENKQGEIVVSLYGRDLINGDYFNPIEIELNEKGLGEIHWSDTKEKIVLDGRGELAGLIEARDELVVEYKDRLNVLIRTLADNINNIHEQGIDLEGNDGEEFFIYSEHDPAATLKLNPVLNDFKKIAASGSGARGDGEIAKKILDLREEHMFNEYTIKDYEYPTSDGEGVFDGVLRIDDFYRDLILSLSLKREEARTMAENQTLLINQMDQRRQEISAVSLDEEMANMLTYQHSYVANSRVINAIDQMMDIMINRMGVVGR